MIKDHELFLLKNFDYDGLFVLD